MPMQHPVVVAKQVATIDRYGGGRFALGLGTGGASRLEIELTGGSFERRWDYTMESIAVMKGLWTEDSFTFEGERSEEHTSELQSLMRLSYAVFCLKKQTDKTQRAH